MVNSNYLYNPAIDVFGKNYSPDKNYFLDKKLGFQVIEHGTILPHKDIWVNGNWTWGKGGIVDENGEYIKSSHVHYGAGLSYTPPPNQFSTAPKPLFISAYGFRFGGIA